MMGSDTKFYILSLIFTTNTMLIVLSAVFGGAGRWRRAQWARFIFLGALCAYLAYGPIGAIRDNIQFHDRNWVLMNIGVAGIVVMIWTVWSERKAQLANREKKDTT